MPAVASRESPDADMSALPSGDATTVVDPLSRTMAPLRADASLTAARRSGPGAWPAKRVSSPSCGVITVGSFRRETMLDRASRVPMALSPSASTTAGTGAPASSRPTSPPGKPGADPGPAVPAVAPGPAVPAVAPGPAVPATRPRPGPTTTT